jgi:hypothetical protein
VPVVSVTEVKRFRTGAQMPDTGLLDGCANSPVVLSAGGAERPPRTALPSRRCSRPIGGSARGYQEPLRCVAVTVTQPGGQRADRMFMHGRASGEHPHLALVVRAVRLAISLMAGTACAGFRIALRRGGMDAASRAGGGVRQAWRRRNERDRTCVAANDTQRAAVFSLQLRRAHQQLRDELARIREALGGDAQRPLH